MCRADHCDAGRDVPHRPGAGGRVTHRQLQSWAGQQAFARHLELRTPHSVVAMSTAASWALEELTPPLVVKALPNCLQHKTDQGLVITGIASHDAAAEATRALRLRLDPDVPVIVQEQVSGVEVLLSMSVDADWGPVLSVGVGGAMVELIADLAILPAPCPVDRVERALRRSRLWALLSGFRGRPPADVDALLGAVERLQPVFLDSDLEVVELNPVIVGSRGTGAFMVDLLTTESESRR
jgi:succinyl-CoA synthetase beta subunit